MPIMWKCPGHPNCKKTYLYVSGMKAHIMTCKHAQKKAVRHKKEEIATMLTIIEFVEDQQKGNVTLARRHVPSFRWETRTFTRSSEIATDWSRFSLDSRRKDRRFGLPGELLSPH
ncbi:uncharacterized protein LOC121372340 [Gigantopelta aegis]|uniref:uncharacterized protein LOC121372340 n=1 Tax=Gigantopelta aegis TaxID=1735272 RepID=UPI001B889BFC|nr:uncharacterized protein LOC121372340 [Gigantopelta aegis]